MSTVRIKICGITRVEDLLSCEQAGVDAFGMVFVPQSKRFIELPVALELDATAGPFITRVGLFLNSEQHAVDAVLNRLPQLIPQFHGNESAAYCEAFACPYIKAIGVGSGMPTQDYLESYTNACAFLFDSNAAGELGGTGHSFDWSLLSTYAGKPLILAGGLSEKNVASAIDMVKPYAVDLSSGVEKSPGIKDHIRIVKLAQIVSEVST